MNIKIAVAYHKKSVLLSHPYLIPVHAGKENATVDLGIQGDNEGDNISRKNPWYCELTVLYWLWKNTKADYKGLMHYRRTFTIRDSFWIKRLGLRLKFLLRRVSSIWSPYNSVGVKKQYACNEEEFVADANTFCDSMNSLLSDGTEMIVPHPGRFYIALRRTLCYEVGGQNIELMNEIVKKNYPEFFPYYEKAMNGLWFYNCNMSVMRNDIFEEYCSLLFNILQQHEEEVVKRGFLKDISTEKAYSRYSGFLAEMLTNAFIQYSFAKKRKIKIMPVAFLTD